MIRLTVWKTVTVVAVLLGLSVLNFLRWVLR